MNKKIKIGFVNTYLKGHSELAQALEWMINHPEERETMGDSACKLIEKECSLEVHPGATLVFMNRF